jgi:SAM-dependent methyltransferase
LKSKLDILELFNNPKLQPAYLNFDLDERILNSKAIQNREVATQKSFEKASLNEIAGQEGSPTYEIIMSIPKLLYDANVIPTLSGIGIELGSGIGLLSAAFIELDTRKKINGILAIEAVYSFVESGIRLASTTTLGNNAHKIIPCYGSFESIPIESGSIDFIIQIEALHHADELLPPLVESYRVLKNGGYFISIDRSWPNQVKRKVLDELLDHQYPKEWLKAKGFPSDEPFSRRDNGEHEYLDSNWIFAFEQAGFKIREIRHLHPRFHARHFLKRFIELFKLNRILKVKIPSRSGIFRRLAFNLVGLKLLNLGSVLSSKHPRPLTVFVLQKNESE